VQTEATKHPYQVDKHVILRVMQDKHVIITVEHLVVQQIIHYFIAQILVPVANVMVNISLILVKVDTLSMEIFV
jgi:phage shock protein PspC (stress-responsive transcriptional regulator)